MNEAMVQPAGFEPDDTQQLPSQLYTDYVNSILNSKEQLASNRTPNDGFIRSDNGHHTYATGDTGHINLIGDGATYDEHEEDPDANMDEISEDELAREDTQTREGIVTSPARMSPTTPAIAGSKRDRQGNILRSAKRTPAPDFSAMFPLNVTQPTIGLSQIFHQTQAVSSPPIGHTRSDAIFERPSPEFNSGPRSSPGPDSSPVMTRKGPIQRAATDPRDIYVSMRDSQDRRRRREQEIQRQLDELEDQDELSQDTEELKAELKRQKAAIAAETSKLFGIITVPSSMKVDRRRKVIEGNPRTPAVQKGKAGHAILISDDTPRLGPDGNEDNDDNVSDGNSDADSRDEFDELSQAVVSVPRSSPRKPLRHELRDLRPSSSPARSSGSTYRAAKSVMLANSFHGNTYITRSSNAENHAPSQTMQVPYSQAGTTGQQDSLPPRPPRPVLASSLDSRTFISQSQQDFSLSSTTRAEIRDMHVEVSSSLPLAPPMPFDDEEGDDGAGAVPTSPPSSPSGATTLLAVEEVLDSRHENQSGDSSRTTEGLRRKVLRIMPNTSPASTSAPHSYPSNGNPHNQEVSSTSMPQEDGTADSRPSMARSNSAGKFDTARTHLSASVVPVPGTSRRSQPQSVTQSPMKPVSIGKMSAIALDPTPPDRNADIALGIDILNENDDDFSAMIKDPVGNEQPRHKRSRRTYSARKALHEPSIEENRPRSPPQVSPLKAIDREIVCVADEHHENNAADANDPLPQEEAAEITHSAPSPRATNQNLKPVVSASLQRNLVGASSQWIARRSRRSLAHGDTDEGAANAVIAAPPAIQVQAQVPHLKIDTNAAVLEASRPFSQRVLARFKGYKGTFWPGTFLGAGTGQETGKVQFDDGNVDEVPMHLVRAFELQPDDIVRIDQDQHRGKTYMVRGVKNPLSQVQITGDQTQDTDVYGNRTVILEVKQKTSAGTGRDIAPQTIEVPICKIYVMPDAWKMFAKRGLDLGMSDTFTRLHTPTLLPSSAPGTPSSRHRRRTFSVAQSMAQPGSFKLEHKAGLFSNMAFAITLTTGSDDDKHSLTQSISENGGSILADNFDTLFDRSPSASVLAGTDAPLSTATAASAGPADVVLSHTAATLGFVALITDTYSRREKYVQALALDIPCLSCRWIYDSAAKAHCMPWDRYLLPAGDSSVLAGAARSRIMSRTSCDATKATLKQTIASRPKLLDGKSVVLIAGKGKAEERKRPFIFLTHALGIKRLDRVKDVAAAKLLLSAPSTDCDYVYVDDTEVGSIVAELAGKIGASKKLKRKSDRGGATNAGAGVGAKLSMLVDVGGRSVRVIGDEFVVQTLILGAVVEE